MAQRDDALKRTQRGNTWCEWALVATAPARAKLKRLGIRSLSERCCQGVSALRWRCPLHARSCCPIGKFCKTASLPLKGPHWPEAVEAEARLGRRRRSCGACASPSSHLPPLRPSPLSRSGWACPALAGAPLSCPDPGRGQVQSERNKWRTLRRHSTTLPGKKGESRWQPVSK